MVQVFATILAVKVCVPVVSANADELITAMTAPNKNKRFVFFISIIHPAIQLFSYSAIQLFSYSAIQLFSQIKHYLLQFSGNKP
ncbi:hypothetical protein EA035_25235 [Salmonella enterica subsp. enterica serovar Give]|nr:hypothetical protein [Salmonella enterica subsp. enterica serovar Give]EAP4147649.1 hypothetical protein [Salmonella enterica subsp. enterica serovar Anatum]EAR0467560.1 hypothetical protein [Salmonella enterica subsp. enterica serovar Poona]EBV6688132.1 hypothetical protein [Salmonella enterica subsp. enterica serovar Oranienburg]EAA8836573.1 hypothetical protein [Salmonella enterica subsp. enterica serovar Give]